MLLPILLAATVALIYSCQKEDVDFSKEMQMTQDAELRQIPLEEALATLEDFLRNNESDMLATRSGSARKIAEISTFFRGGGNMMNLAPEQLKQTTFPMLIS